MSIRWKLVIISVALVFIVMVAIGTFVLYALRLDAENSARSELALWADDLYINVINHSFSAAADLEDFESRISNSFEPLATQRLPVGMDAFIITAAGPPQTLETNARPRGHYAFITRSVITSALAGLGDFDTSRSYPDAFGETNSWFEYARPIFLTSYHYPDYVVYMRMSANEFFDGLDVTRNIITLASAMALGVATLLAIAFSMPLTKNLFALSREIKDFKVGDATKINLPGANDEVGDLAESFNTMSGHLRKNIAEMTNEKNKMEIIMYNMTDGVLAYDGKGLLIHSNHACEELLAMDRIAEMPMEEIFAVLDIEIPPEGVDNMEDVTISRGEKFINASFNAHKNAKGEIQGVIVVLQDITRHMRLDNMRKEFVANVSHELRTPLTTIKSYAETLLDGAGENPDLRDEFLEVINNESDRMTAIIRDLLELSRFDNKRMEFEFELGDVVALLEKNLHSHAITAEKQGKTITLHSEVARADVMMDAARIDQVVNNIVSNALRYSHAGAKIDVEVQERGLFYMVYIHDNGIGIPKEDLRMIFERFYRVDKARSRELGGTGLGLSIAREIMEGHGGRIHASSELGVGTTMTLRFPKP
ncbi:MAG: cell wall metabolism sensor histidine kinase WalK [Defluviitaleaceae bacterium]|nr:cell wall metabolism sensor histidine kinase WalK [Defluviitaleaceae bacterium]